MQWRRHVSGLVFGSVFVVSYFTNKFVLSVLNFTYPTLFQGWQTLIGAVLLLLSGKLGWVEMRGISRSAAVSCLPGSVLFLGNIYAGSRALSHIDIPFFFTLQNSSHVVSYFILKVLQREKTRRLKLISIALMLLSAVSLPFHDPQSDRSGYLWAVGHLLCVGAYRVFQVHYKSSNLSDLEQQCINYLFRRPQRRLGVPVPPLVHVPLRLLCQRPAGVPAAARHREAEERTVPGALRGVDVPVQGRGHEPVAVLLQHGRQRRLSGLCDLQPRRRGAAAVFRERLSPVTPSTRSRLALRRSSEILL
uniref:Transmembrane protein 241 n=1 Tax=Salarias fasciatus TaxID=181472 RepID=A0A672FPK1_SALFA